MNKAIFITVRTNSTRLPRKALIEISGVPTITRVIRRMKRSTLKDFIVLCTTTEKDDDVLATIAQQEDIRYFRGSVNDKLERWNGAATYYAVEFFVTADGDDLFCEPELIDLAFQQYEKNKADFIEGSELACGAFTYGIKASALSRVCEIKDTDDTEMMWTYFKNTNLFQCEELQGINAIYKRPDIRITLDYPDDLMFFTRVIEHFEQYDPNAIYSLSDIIHYLDQNPHIIKINQYLMTIFLDNQKKKTTLKIKNPTLAKNANIGKFTGNEIKYVTEVLESEMKSATGGSWNNRLEKMFAKKFNAKYAVAQNSGTSALHSCLSAAGVGPGDEVISPAITVIMNTLATLYQNAVPVYVDIDPETFNIDPKDIEKKITPRTKAIFTVSLYGLSPDMDPIMEIAKKHNLVVIEDNAQCFLGYYKGRVAGSIGHMSIFSFENSKHISVGEGGIIITSDETLAERARKCGGIGFKNLQAEEGRVKLNEEVFQDPAYKRHDYLGWNYRLTEVCAAIAVAQLERLEEIVEKRKQIAQMYDLAIKGCPWLIPQKIPAGYIHSYWTYAIKYEGEIAIGVSWKDFYKTYKEMGGDGFYAAWSLPYLEPIIANGNYYGKGSHYTGPKFEYLNQYKIGSCPIAESIQPKIMQFKTNYRDISLAEQKIESLKKTIEKFKK